jgi:uncharacterized protein YpmB
LSGYSVGEDQHSTHTQVDIRKDVIKIASLKINEGNSFHHISTSVVKKTTAEEMSTICDFR